MKRLSVLSPFCILRQESMLNLANTSTIKYICGAGVSLYSTGGGTDRLQLTTFALKKLWVGFFIGINTSTSCGDLVDTCS